MSLGSQTEAVVKARLMGKCNIMEDPEFDHVHKIDFVINQFKQIAKLQHIGIQLTTNPFDAGKKAKFVFERQKGELVQKSLYVDIHPNANLDRGGVELLYIAIGHFAFSTEYSDKNIMGISIRPDYSYEFYDIEKEVETARTELKLPFESQPAEETAEENTTSASAQCATASHDANNTQPASTRYHGTIRKYFSDKKYGFVNARFHGKEEYGEWFFHITDCDLHLRNLINNRLATDRFDGIDVLFTDAGYVRKNVQAPEAMDITLKL